MYSGVSRRFLVAAFSDQSTDPSTAAYISGAAPRMVYRQPNSRDVGCPAWHCEPDAEGPGCLGLKDIDPL